jgi:DNA-3-methyladenine glycosylase II
LPDDYPLRALLAFHRRDPDGAAEHVGEGTVRKGIIWNASPALLRLTFEKRSVAIALAVDGPAVDGDAERLRGVARHMLGLDQPVAEFERAFAGHPCLGRLIASNRGLRVPQTATPFEALTWAIIGQQISVNAATSIRRRLIRAASVRHSSGFYCYPDASCLVALGEDELRRAGLSRSKVQAVHALSRSVLDGALNLASASDGADIDDVCARLRRIRGIGPWTVNYTLLRGFGWLDASLEGDVAVRRNLMALRGLAEMPTQEETRRWLAEFAPWRSLVAAHLWAMRSSAAY